MPASITLTVSNLPTSTSFFLSALQPLNYAYRGRAEQTVGFGPVNSSAPADFWITQEIPGVPAGAAHVAFPAPNKNAVQDFFHAALKAGARIHGEPCTRDAYGYYSAAVIDFDGNSIEAVYRPPYGGDNRDNDAGTVISKRSRSKAPSTVSRAPTYVSKAQSTALTTVSKARSTAPSTIAVPEPKAEPPKGDALESLLNQARSTADVARKLVEQVRPHLPTTNSAPAAPKQVIHNPDAFAKPGTGGDTIVGTLLGVAAGAALTYAFTSSRKSSPSNEASDNERSHQTRRPSLADTGRSVTAPAPYHHHHSDSYRAIEAAPSHYIAMNDNDYASTVKPSTAHRRGSVDSGLGISPPSTSSKTSKRSMKMLEPPPTSYKAPTVITQAMTAATGHSRSRSKTRDADAAASRPSSRTRRSRSESRSRHSRHDSGVSTSGYETVLHVTTQRAYAPVPAASAKWAEHRQLPLPNESVSTKATSKSKAKSRDDAPPPKSAAPASQAGSRATTVKPADYPLPPSRAATWVAGGPRSSSNSKAESFVSARSGRGRRDGAADDGAKTVIGKMRDVARLRVREGEVRPEDSVSQVSSVRSRR